MFCVLNECVLSSAPVKSKLFFVSVLFSQALCRSPLSESVGGSKANVRPSYTYRQGNLGLFFFELAALL